MLPNCQPNSCRPQAQNLTPLSLWQSCLQMGPRGTRKIQWLTMILRWNCHLIEISPRAVEFTTLQVPKNSKLSCWGKDADVRVEENKWWSLLLHLFEVLLPLWVLKEWLWLSSSKLKALHGVTHQPLVSLKPTASSDLRSVSSGVGICPQLHHLSGGKIWSEWYRDAQQSGLVGLIFFIHVQLLQCKGESMMEKIFWMLFWMLIVISKRAGLSCRQRPFVKQLEASHCGGWLLMVNYSSLTSR